MPQKENAAALTLTFLATTVLAGTGFWWLSQTSLKTISSLLSHPNSVAASDRFSSVKNVPAQEFKYGGSTTWAPIRPPVYDAIQASHPDFRLVYTDPPPGSNLTPGSGSGIQMLIDGQLAFSVSSRALKDKDLQKAKRKNVQLSEVAVAFDGIAIVVNRDLNLKGLTLEQIKNIYAGNITNWQEVGGPDLPITPYSRGKEGGTVDFFKEHLKLETFGANVVFVQNTTIGLRKIGRDPGGIYYASAPEAVPQCTVKTLPIGAQTNNFVPPYEPPFVKSVDCPMKRNIVNTEAFQKESYPITRKLFVIINRNGRIEQEAGEAYVNLLLTPEGQDLIEKAGFVKIRSE
jgi:phosphate transport system substrate-binding protein